MLVDALALTADLDWLVNVEIKSFPESPAGPDRGRPRCDRPDRDGEPGVALELRSPRAGPDPEAALPADQELLAIPRGVLASTPLSRPHEYLAGIVGAQTYHVSASSLGAESIAYRRRPSAERLQAEGLAELKAAGIPILVYTVNDVRPGGLAEHLAELGVDALFTDDPRGMRALFG